MQNTQLDEEQAGIKIAVININNLRHDDTTLMRESKEELKRKGKIEDRRRRG